MSIFDKVSAVRPRRNVFSLSHQNLLTTQFGKLTPFYVDDLVPGDYFKGSATTFMRFAPLVSPIMHDVNVYTHFFFVPRRLIQSDFEDFITGGDNGEYEGNANIHSIGVTPQSAPGFDNLQRDLFRRGTLCDYLGIPVRNIPDSENFLFHQVDISPFLAYQLIFNEYYRDQNCQTEIDLEIPGFIHQGEYNELFRLRYRNWEKDYFTSGLPFTQKGAPVKIPFGSSFDLEINSQLTVDSQANNQRMLGVNTNQTTVNFKDLNNVWSTTPPTFKADGTASASEANAPDINDLRTAFQVQKWLERNARAGSRYVEQILSHFGIRSKDARLQRPEFIGGGRVQAKISEVLQTSQSQDTPQGNMSGHGFALGNSNQFRYKATEHGFIMGIMSVLPRTSYMDGLPRMFQRRSRFDHYWPEFAHLGEQPIYNSEVFDSGRYATVTQSEVPFAYQPRYTEYKYKPSSVHGDFLDLQSLGSWHMARAIDSTPIWDSQFVSSRDATNRIFAVTGDDGTLDYDPLWCQIKMHIRAIRPIPRYSDPGLIDHF